MQRNTNRSGFDALYTLSFQQAAIGFKVGVDV
jgi:hypothetical protein